MVKLKPTSITSDIKTFFVASLEAALLFCCEGWSSCHATGRLPVIEVSMSNGAVPGELFVETPDSSVAFVADSPEESHLVWSDSSAELSEQLRDCSVIEG